MQIATPKCFQCSAPLLPSSCKRASARDYLQRTANAPPGSIRSRVPMPSFSINRGLIGWPSGLSSFSGSGRLPGFAVNNLGALGFGLPVLDLHLCAIFEVRLDSAFLPSATQHFSPVATFPPCVLPPSAVRTSFGSLIGLSGLNVARSHMSQGHCVFMRPRISGCGGLRAS